MFEEVLSSTLRLAIPLILVAFSGLLSERSGVANIALEAQIIFSAFFAGTITVLCSSPYLGLLGAILGAVMISCVFAFFCTHGRGDNIVVGTAINVFTMGLVPVLNKSLFSITGSTPSLALSERFQSPYPFASIALVEFLLIYFLLFRTPWGIRLNAAGENPSALVTQGISAIKIRYQAILVGSISAGFAGAYLSLCQGSGYVRNMSAGRGFMALAALILGGWKPLPTVIACFIFAFFDSIQMRLQGLSVSDSTGQLWVIPNQFIQILPFVVTLLGLAFFGGKMQPPRAINR